MKSSALLCLAALSCLPSIDLGADDPVEVTVRSEKEVPVEKEKTLLTAAQIDELLAPIALYPDPLVALILPASTFPTDIVLAARYLKDGKDPEEIENQTWDDSVKALARYPEVVKWMDENLAWTQQVGAAFLVQPAAVMNGTQRLRAAAVAAGNLKDTPEQKVVVEREVIRIVPAEREVIYVPVYDPIYVYRPRVVEVCDPGPLVTFSVGYRTGFWLSYYCNWGYSSVVYVNRPYRTVYWHSHPAWSCPGPAVVVHHHIWRPAPVRVQAVCRDFERRPVHRVVQPTANTYVQHRPDRDRETRPAHGFTRSDNPDGRAGRPEAGNPARRGTVAASPATNRRDRGELSPRPSSSEESPRIEPTPTPAAPAPVSGSPARTERQVADRKNRENSDSTRVRVSSSVSAAPAAPVAERPRPSRAFTATVNTETSAPSPAPRVDRRDRRAPTATASADTHGASVASSGDRSQGENQSFRRSSGGFVSSAADAPAGDVPAARHAPATSGSSRRNDSRRGDVSGNPGATASTSASISGSGQRRSANPEPARGAAIRSETQSSSPGRTIRQSRGAEATTTDVAATETDSSTADRRSRR